MQSKKKIKHVDRWAVQNDMHELCTQGSIPVREYLDFSDAYLAETSALASSDVAVNLARDIMQICGRF